LRAIGGGIFSAEFLIIVPSGESIFAATREEAITFKGIKIHAWRKDRGKAKR